MEKLTKEEYEDILSLFENCQQATNRALTQKLNKLIKGCKTIGEARKRIEGIYKATRYEYSPPSIFYSYFDYFTELLNEMAEECSIANRCEND